MRSWILAIFLIFPCASALAGIGHVSKVRGDVFVLRGGLEQPLTLNATIESADTIRSAKDAVAEITFIDDSHFTVGSNSKIVIDRFIYDASSDKNTSEISIVKGVFRFASGKIAKANPRRAHYKTPVATIGIRGTEAFGEVRANGHTLLGLNQCCVDVVSRSGTMTLKEPNTFSQVKTPYDAPSYPAQCTAAWLNQTAEALGAAPSDLIYAQATTLQEALSQGQYHLNLRYRMEHVDDDAFVHDALAHTLRTAMDYKTARYRGMSAFAEIESTSRGSDDRYHDTLNGNAAYPTIPDSGSLELNQLYLAYEGLFDTHAALGRQRITYNNQRFVGASSFRQDSQTFDAFTLHDRHVPDTDLRYAYIDQVHNSLPDDTAAGRRDSNSHLFNLTYGGLAIGSLTAYGYLIDLDNTPTLSSQTYGLRFAGLRRMSESISGDYAIEYARQRDYAGNPIHFDADYYHAAGMLSYRAFSLGGGYEAIGSDEGSTAMQFPLATKHIFNGEADKFLTTPAAGLIDAYLEIGYVVSGAGMFDGTKLSTNYHDYSAEDGNANYGHEWGTSVGMPFLKHYYADLRVAHYEAEDLFRDTQKVWFAISASF